LPGVGAGRHSDITGGIPMTSIARLSCSWQMDTMAATDVANINPCFKVVQGPVFAAADWQALCEDLATALKAFAVLDNQLTVKAYDCQGAKPNYPLATAVRDAGTAVATNINRDVALCLSFFSDTNRPRQRGRLYIPCCICAIQPSGAYATAAHMNTVGTLATTFSALGGINVDWVVFSKKDNTSHPVTNWYVDNNWDTQRRRGPRSTARVSGTTTEGSAPNFAGFSPVDGRSLAAAWPGT
jgi:hypothetical protein